MEVHTWKERTEEGTLVYRACHHAGKWKLECAPKVGRCLLYTSDAADEL